MGRWQFDKCEICGKQDGTFTGKRCPDCIDVICTSNAVQEDMPKQTSAITKDKLKPAPEQESIKPKRGRPKNNG